MTPLAELLKHHVHFAPVVLNAKPYRKLDFSIGNEVLREKDLSDIASFTRYVFNDMLSQGDYYGVGGYNENRIIYRQLHHFVQPEAQPRCIHLGIDIWTPAGEPIYAPFPGKVHSFAFNDHEGDYGPTLILEHQIQELTCYTLYGHLSLDSLPGLFPGKKFEAGDQIATVGDFPINGNWPPHLHFQIIENMGSYNGDFPGVCSEGDRSTFLTNCPDPNLILRIPELG